MRSLKREEVVSSVPLDEDAKPMSMATAARIVAEGLCWDRNSPAEEQALAMAEAERALHHELNDRVEILRVVAALARSPIEALAELQKCRLFAGHPAGMVDLGLFECHLLGAASGGIDGPYGRQYLATLAAAGPYVANLH